MKFPRSRGGRCVSATTIAARSVSSLMALRLFATPRGRGMKGLVLNCKMQRTVVLPFVGSFRNPHDPAVGREKAS